MPRKLAEANRLSGCQTRQPQVGRHVPHAGGQEELELLRRRLFGEAKGPQPLVVDADRIRRVRIRRRQFRVGYASKHDVARRRHGTREHDLGSIVTVEIGDGHFAVLRRFTVGRSDVHNRRACTAKGIRVEWRRAEVDALGLAGYECQRPLIVVSPHVDLGAGKRLAIFLGLSAHADEIMAGGKVGHLASWASARGSLRMLRSSSCFLGVANSRPAKRS